MNEISVPYVYVYIYIIYIDNIPSLLVVINPHWPHGNSYMQLKNKSMSYMRLLVGGNNWEGTILSF